MNQFIPTTAYPSERLPKYKWLKEVCKKEFNVSHINPNTILGECIANAYEVNPEGTLEMISDLAVDNPKLMEIVIGKSNLKYFI